MESGVGLLGRSFTREHPSRILLLPLEGEHAGRVRKLAGDVLLKQPLESVAPRPVSGQGDLGHPGMRQRLMMKRDSDLGAPHVINELLAGVLGNHPVPPLQRAEILGIHLGCGRCDVLGEIDRRQFGRSSKSVEAVRGHSLATCPIVVATHLIDDFCEVPAPVGGNDMPFGFVGRR